MDVQTIQIILQQQNRWACFFWIFNFNNFGIWSHRKQKYFISRKSLYETVLWILKRTRENYNWFWKEKMWQLTKEELKSRQDANVCYICGIRIFKDFSKSINYEKVRDHCYVNSKYSGAEHSICNLKCNMSNEIAAVFHNGSHYGYHFIIKWLANKFEEILNVLGKVQNFLSFSK